MGTLPPIRHLPFVDPGLPILSERVRGAMGLLSRELEIHHATGGLDPSLIGTLRGTPPVSSSLWLGAGSSSGSGPIRPKASPIRLAAATGVSSWLPVGEEAIPDRVEIDPVEVFCHYIDLSKKGPTPFPLVMIPPIKGGEVEREVAQLKEASQAIPGAEGIIDLAKNLMDVVIAASQNMQLPLPQAQLGGGLSDYRILVDDPAAVGPQLETFLAQYRMLVRIYQGFAEDGKFPHWLHLKSGSSRRLAGLEKIARDYVREGFRDRAARAELLRPSKSALTMIVLDQGGVSLSPVDSSLPETYSLLPVSQFQVLRFFLGKLALGWAQKAIQAGDDFLRPLLVNLAQETGRQVRVLVQELRETLAVVRRRFQALPQTLRDLEGLYGERLGLLEQEINQIEETARVDLRQALTRATILKGHLHRGPYLSIELASLLLEEPTPSGMDLANALYLTDASRNQVQILERHGRLDRRDERRRILDERMRDRQRVVPGIDEGTQAARAEGEAAAARELAERQALEEAAAMEGLLQGEAERLGAGARREEEIRARDRRLWIRLEEELSRLLTTLENDLLDEVGIERSSELEEDWIDLGGRTIYLRRARQEEVERLRRRLDREFKRPLSEAADSEAVIASLRRLVNSVRDDTAFLHQRGRARG